MRSPHTALQRLWPLTHVQVAHTTNISAHKCYTCNNNHHNTQQALYCYICKLYLQEIFNVDLADSVPEDPYHIPQYACVFCQECCPVGIEEARLKGLQCSSRCAYHEVEVQVGAERSINALSVTA
jgi:hypothetical protein